MLLFAVVIFSILVFAFLFYASYSIHSNVYLHALCKLSTEEKHAVITFDDGPSKQTAKVLDILHEKQVKALFFLIGERAKEHPDLVKRMVAEGHQIGIHSMQHRWYFPFGSKKKIKEDLCTTREILETLSGTEVNYFRPPFGVTNPNIGVAVHELGLRTIGWSIRSYDTNANTPREKVIRRIEKHLKPGAIILLHDDRENSDQLLSSLLQMIGEKGYKVVSL